MLLYADSLKGKKWKSCFYLFLNRVGTSLLLNMFKTFRQFSLSISVLFNFHYVLYNTQCSKNKNHLTDKHSDPVAFSK